MHWNFERTDDMHYYNFYCVPESDAEARAHRSRADVRDRGDSDNLHLPVLNVYLILMPSFVIFNFP